ncbi:ABC transporter permease subunit [Clostridium colicanis]|uniref:ABC-2 family transporter protein n=1 Tax=Clostridium colicanis DSM 13634 TaxID=1121305 RepID=A0A151AMS3_9CLOT|nr:ABC transporter permease subunit [Clostridium colicanis]KYH28936.1 ABC-2 family transporter protein [Clostridium colicanis DSM 13634]
MMITLIRNEIIKLMQRRKTLVVTGLFILLVGFMAFASYKNAESMNEWNKPERRIQNEQENIAHLNKMKNDTSIPEEEKLHFDEEIKQANLRIEEIKKEQSSGKKDWRVTLKEEIKQVEGQINNTQINNEEKERLNIDLMTKKYLLDKDIEPEYNSYDVTATKFIRDLFNILGVIFLAVGITIFSSDMVSGEYTPPTMKFLLTQPVSRGKVLLSKFIALTLSSSIIIVLIEIIVFLVVGFIFSFGNMDYPVAVGSRFVYDNAIASGMGQKVLKMVAGSTTIIPMWKYLIQMFLLQILFIIASAAFAFLLSTIVKSSMVSMAINIVLIIAFTMFQNIPYVSKYVHYIFSIFGDPSMVLSGRIATQFNNPNITIGFTIGVLVIWTIVSYVISHVVFTKKDILI